MKAEWKRIKPKTHGDSILSIKSGQ